MAWCWMKVKLKKSRSLSIRKDEIRRHEDIVCNQQILTVSQKPVESLRRWYDSSMKDITRGFETAQLAIEGHGRDHWEVRPTRMGEAFHYNLRNMTKV